MLRKEVNEGAYARRQRSATAQENGVDVFPISWVECLEHRHEPPGLDVRTYVKS
jgi:hypothetical protein